MIEVLIFWAGVVFFILLSLIGIVVMGLRLLFGVRIWNKRDRESFTYWLFNDRYY